MLPFYCCPILINPSQFPTHRDDALVALHSLLNKTLIITWLIVMINREMRIKEP